ncbi:hypothetical protein EDB86DRAFT_2920822, partial [Lactarius hatsudake]
MMPPLSQPLPVLTASSLPFLGQVFAYFLHSPPPLLYPLRHRIHVRIQWIPPFLRAFTMNMRGRERKGLYPGPTCALVARQVVNSSRLD